MANVNGTEIDLMPTGGMREEAERYRAWKADGEQGGTEVAATRASQILSGDELSPDTVITMAAWFARHEVDKQGEGFSPGEDGFPSPGRVAWAAWGGDAGQSWSTSKADRIKALQDRAMDPVTEQMMRSEPVALTRAQQIDEEDRTLEFPFSSEYPVARYFGNEILAHTREAVDLARLNDGAPLLFNHDPDKLIGVVERAWVDEDQKRGYARVRMSRNPFAQEVMNDVRDGVLRNVSFGYAINDMEQRGEDFIVTRWSAHELSLVSIPADPTIGVGRSLDAPIAATAASSVPPSTDMEDNTTDLMAVRAEAASEAAKAERTRISGITAITEKHGMADLGRQLIESGRSLDEARAAVLDQLGAKAQPVSESAGDIGLSAKETREFSFQRAINALANPGDRKLQEAAAFERECSEAAAQRAGKVAQGIMVPSEVLRRDLTVGTASGAGDLVGTDFRPGSFIELLRNRSALAGLGVTSLTGLTGNVAIPRQTAAATAFWVAESGSPTESQQTVDQVNLSPKTVGAFTDYSRRLMLQASIDVEQMIRQDLATVLALEIDRCGLYGLGNTSQPLGIKLTTGINTEDFGAATPTYSEVVSMESKIAADNADIGAMAYLMNATMRGSLKTKDKGTDTGAYVFEPGGTVNGYNAVVSNQVESGDIFFAVWSQLVQAMWSGLDLTVDPYTHSTSGTIRVVALQDVDFAVRHPEGFCRGNNTL
jgi:HK97 family phage major capsid protein/HK97 family phage prohead protease